MTERLYSGALTAISKPEIPTEIEDVRIMSLHKSKGLSAPVTIIAGCVQGLLQEGRLLNLRSHNKYSTTMNSGDCSMSV